MARARIQVPLGDDEGFLKGAVEVLADDAEALAVHLLLATAPIARAARDDRVEDDLRADACTSDALADRVDDACAVRPEDRGQRPLRQSARDEDVEMIERARAKAHADLARPRLG